MEGMIDQLPSRICLDFDIITFNDMCPKCFSTAFFRFDEMKLEINKQLSLYFQSAQKTELLSKKFPIIFRILISSSRPYKIETAEMAVNLKTRECEACRKNSTEPCPLVKTLAARHISVNGERDEAIPIGNGVFQFVNPWIEEVFNPTREKYQAIVDKAEQLHAELGRIARLETDTQVLRQAIQQALLQIVPASISSVKNLLSFDIKTLDKLLEQAGAIQ